MFQLSFLIAHKQKYLSSFLCAESLKQTFKKKNREHFTCFRFFFFYILWTRAQENICSESRGTFALTHLPELMVDQLQPGHVQVVQVVAAVARRLDAARRLLRAAALTARQLRQQSGAIHKDICSLLKKNKTKNKNKYGICYRSITRKAQRRGC